MDLEVGVLDHKIHDIGALRHDGAVYHHVSRDGLLQFIDEVDFLCGHNIVHHDAAYLFGEKSSRWHLVDTLYLSPLLFPERPYHKLVKDDKLLVDQANNPVNDCEKARDLLFDELAKWEALPENTRRVYSSLLKDKKEFEGFFRFAGDMPEADNLPDLIRETYEGKICAHADIERLVDNYPCELAYALALVDTTDQQKKRRPLCSSPTYSSPNPHRQNVSCRDAPWGVSTERSPSALGLWASPPARTTGEARSEPFSVPRPLDFSTPRINHRLNSQLR